MSEIDDIKRRLFSVIPTSSLHMMEFLKLMNIRFVDDNETNSAAVTCSTRPELLLNRNFVEEHCKTDEHLFMLVMHELYHIILGHTHLFKRHSAIDNIAFDAVINAILCRLFPEEEYTSFFKEINTDKSFPGCILRPIGNKTPLKYISVLKSLYYTNTGTYFEVYECITHELERMLKDGEITYVLLGNHTDNNDDMNNPLLKKMLDDVVSKWPRQFTVEGRDLGGELQDKEIEFAKANRIAQNKMNRLLRKSGVIKGSVSKHKTSIQQYREDAVTVVPDYRDRTLLTKSIVYQQPILYNSSLLNTKVVRESNVQTLVYLDVSGSVDAEIKHFAPLLLRPYKNKECLLFAFSTLVVPVTYSDFKKGKYKSTGGTEINCIFEHYFSLPKKQQAKKVLILTDGYTGNVNPSLYVKIREQKIEVYCGLFGRHTKEYMNNIVKYFEEFD